MPAAACAKVLPSRKRGEIAQVGVGDEDDVAPASAIAAVWTAFRHVLLAAEAD